MCGVQGICLGQSTQTMHVAFCLKSCRKSKGRLQRLQANERACGCVRAVQRNLRLNWIPCLCDRVKGVLDHELLVRTISGETSRAWRSIGPAL